MRIGEIDTVKEQFQAEILIEAKWIEPSLKPEVKFIWKFIGNILFGFI